MMDIKRILLVDDDADIRTIGEVALRNVGGFYVVSAGSGLEAIEVFADADPDVILLDVMMPGLDGPQTLLRLREAPASKDIPVIFVTAKAQPAEVERYLAAGAVGVITKPFDPMTLADEVRALVSKI